MPTQDITPEATPQPASGDTSTVIGLQLPEQYLMPRSNVFHGLHSFWWFVRKHKPALVEAGAIVAPAGRLLVNPEVFDRMVLTVGPGRVARVR